MVAIAKSTSVLIYRHTAPIRIMHWVNVICFIVLFMSGLNIFNAHPALNIGKSSYNKLAPVLEISAHEGVNGTSIGKTNILGYAFNTTGVLGVSTIQGQPVARVFPAWATIPSVQWLAMARNWHFFFAWLFVINGLCYVTYSFYTKHMQRDIAFIKRDRGTL